MRIGFFTDTYTSQVNGVVSSIDNTRQSLEALGHTVSVFAPALPRRTKGVKPKRLQNVLYVDDAHEKNVFRFPSTSFLYGWVYPDMRMPLLPVKVKFWKQLLAMDFDIIHSHDFLNMGIFAEFFARHRKIPHVHTYHTVFSDYVHHFPGHKFLPAKQVVEGYSSFFCNACDAIVAPSQKIAGMLKQYHVRTPMEVIANGVDVRRFQNVQKGFLRQRLHLSKDAEVLLYVGRLAKEKNIDFLVDALPRVLRDHPKAVFVLVGTGPQEKAIRARVAKVGIADRTHFAGVFPYQDIPSVFADGDLFLFPSLSENNPMVVLESLVSGIPIVTLKDAAYDGFVIDGVNGFQTARTHASFAKAVSVLLSSPEKRLQFARAARMTGLQYDVRVTAEKLVALYKRTIAACARHGF